MEIDVTPILSENCRMLSASRAELGENAGRITWNNCLKLAKRLPLVTNENRDEIRKHFGEYGAWEREEIAAWSDVELSALIWQEAAADMRHFQEHCNFDVSVYEEHCESGKVSGRLSIGEKSAFIYIGI
jgi:hypothetical protein